MGKLLCVVMWYGSPDQDEDAGKGLGTKFLKPKISHDLGDPTGSCQRGQPDIWVQRSEGRSRLETNLEFTKSRFFNPWEPMKSPRQKGGARREGTEEPPSPMSLRTLEPSVSDAPSIL